MIRNTSRRSAKATPKTVVAKADTNGTPPIEESSESTSGSTSWTVELTGGRALKVTIPGNGRISYGGPNGRYDNGAEVRFYRNQTTKTYEGVIAGVQRVYSNSMLVEEIGKTAEAAKIEMVSKMAEEHRAKEMMGWVSEAIVKREYEHEEPPF